MSIRSAADNPYKLVAFDVDGTLVEGTLFIWDALHDHFACDAQLRRQAYLDYKAGRISYNAWFGHDIKLLRQAGATREAMLHVVRRLRPRHGAVELLGALRGAGYRIAVISGSVRLVLDEHFDPGLFDHVFINRFAFDDAGRLIGGQATPYDMQAKADGLREAAQREGLRLDQCVFAGDNVNDLSAMRAAGLAIAVMPHSDEVRAVAHHVVEDGDLRILKQWISE